MRSEETFYHKIYVKLDNERVMKGTSSMWDIDGETQRTWIIGIYAFIGIDY